MIRLDIDIQKECLESLNRLQTLGEAREEAIKTLKHYHRENDYGAPKDLIMAIKILEQPPDKDWEKYSEKLWKLAYERGKQDAVNGSTGDMPNFQSRENTTNNVIDAVSREDVIGKINWWFRILNQNPDILIDAINTLQSVTICGNCDGR